MSLDCPYKEYQHACECTVLQSIGAPSVVYSCIFATVLRIDSGSFMTLIKMWCTITKHYTCRYTITITICLKYVDTWVLNIQFKTMGINIQLFPLCCYNNLWGQGTVLNFFHSRLGKPCVNGAHFVHWGCCYAGLGLERLGPLKGKFNAAA